MFLLNSKAKERLASLQELVEEWPHRMSMLLWELQGRSEQPNKSPPDKESLYTFKQLRPSSN